MNLHENNKRIAKNTLLLYGRMFFLLFLNIYTSRIVLKALGVEDYGIYNVVGGFVFLFQVFVSAVSVAISRFLTFELGKGNSNKLKAVFSTALATQLFMAFIVLLLFETIGLWFLNCKLVIPDNRLFAANVAFQASVFAFIIGLLNSPFNALIISHEKMSAFASISIIDGVLKLMVAFATLLIVFDRLIVYGILMSLITIACILIRIVYCLRNFEECKLKIRVDKQLFKAIFSFAGWTYTRSASDVALNQGGNMLINIFFGPSVNAARGVAIQIQHAANGFVSNFMTALSPQITKNYASGNTDYTNTLVMQGARFSFYLLLIICLPIFFNSDYILSVWLTTVPNFSSIFLKLLLIVILVTSLYETSGALIAATGKIKYYNLIIAIIRISGLVITYILYYMDFPPQALFVVNIFIEIGILFDALFTLKRNTNFKVGVFLYKVLLKIIFVSIFSSLMPLFYYLTCYTSNLKGFVISSMLCLFSSFCSIYFIGCNCNERGMIKKQFLKLLKRF